MNKKYLLNGFEYSVEEIQDAADRNKVTFEEYINSKGFEVVEEKIETEQQQAVPDWAWDASGIVEETKQPTKTEVLLQDNTLQEPVVEDTAITNFKTSYLDGKFDQWLQSPQQIEAGKKEAKARNRIELKTIFNKWISWGKISSKLGKRKTKKRN